MPGHLPPAACSLPASSCPHCAPLFPPPQAPVDPTAYNFYFESSSADPYSGASALQERYPELIPYSQGSYTLACLLAYGLAGELAPANESLAVSAARRGAARRCAARRSGPGAVCAGLGWAGPGV